MCSATIESSSPSSSHYTSSLIIIIVVCQLEKMRFSYPSATNVPEGVSEQEKAKVEASKVYSHTMDDQCAYFGASSLSSLSPNHAYN